LKIEQGAVRQRNEYNIDILRYLGIRDIIQVQHKMNISIVFRWIMPGRGVRRTRHSPTKVSNGITTVQTCFTIILFLTACQLGCVKASSAFECYTGDGSIMRRKSCPVADFSDLCFKKEGEDGEGETMRGCFNSIIANLILDNPSQGKLEAGCYPIPRRLGVGTICICDSNLCNSATSLKTGVPLTPYIFSISSIMSYVLANRLVFGLLLIVSVLLEQMTQL